MPDFLIPSSPLVSGLIALAIVGGTWFALRLFTFTDEDDEE